MMLPGSMSGHAFETVRSSARGSSSAAPESIDVGGGRIPSASEAAARPPPRAPRPRSAARRRAAGRARRSSIRANDRRRPRRRRRPAARPGRPAPAPASAGSRCVSRTSPSRTSNTVEMPVVVSSSSPSSPRKTFARTPRRARTSAMSGSMRSSEHPDDLRERPRRVRERTEEVEDRGHAELAPHRRGVRRPPDGTRGANMKPMPASARHRCTPPGVEVDLDAERLEHVGRAAVATRRRGCRVWPPGTPAPATTIAATVEMLNVPLRSPPVPQVSTTGVPGCDGARESERRRGETLQLVDGLALGAERHQEPADLARATPRRS